MMDLFLSLWQALCTYLTTTCKCIINEIIIFLFQTKIRTISKNKDPTPNFVEEKESCLKYFDRWKENEQLEFVQTLISHMCHYQHGQINSYLKPMLQRDFITALPSKYLVHSKWRSLLF